MSDNIKKYRIGFLTAADGSNRRTWSGTPSFIADALNKNIGEVVFLGPVRLRVLFAAFDRINILLILLFKKRYYYSWGILVSWIYGKVFSNKVRKGNFDFLISPAGFTEFAYLKTNVPIIYCCDSTLKQIIDYNPGMLDLLSISKKELNFIEKRAIDKAFIICYSSQWAANSAIIDYNAEGNKIFVLPFGANINQFPEKDLVLKKKKGDKCRLLFMGNNWRWKGGSIAFDTLIELTKLGIDCELTVCGCIPPDHFQHEKLTIIPFLDKNDPIQFGKLKNLFWDHDFLILPTRSDCYGLVFCEASAYGMPSFATDTGGVSGVVIEGENGYLLPFEATGKDFALKIKEVFNDENLYNNLKIKSRELFEEKLNWDVWAINLRAIMDSDLTSNNKIKIYE